MKKIFILSTILLTGCASASTGEYCKLTNKESIIEQCQPEYTGAKVGYINNIFKFDNKDFVILQLNGVNYFASNKVLNMSEQNLDFYASANVSFKFEYGHYKFNAGKGNKEADILTKIQVWA